jgi:hypothetical protein
MHVHTRSIRPMILGRIDKLYVPFLYVEKLLLLPGYSPSLGIAFEADSTSFGVCSFTNNDCLPVLVAVFRATKS